MRPFTRREMATNTAYIVRNFPSFQRRPFTTRETIQAFQLKHLKTLVAFAYQNVDLYRETYDAASVHPKDLQRLEDLEFFPTVSKNDVLAAYPEGALSRDLDLDRCILSKSSGSTGQVLDVVHQADRLGIQGLAMYRLFGLYGTYLPWHRQVYIYTSEYPTRGVVGMFPMVWIPTLAPIEETAVRLRRIRPSLLACYPSHLRALAAELGDSGCVDLRLRAISVSSELSTQNERDDLAEQFGCGVYDEYSTEELTRVAAQCRQGSYHIFEDLVYLESLSPIANEPARGDQIGEVVGTYLHNYTMPFIRYRQGDYATIEEADCPCGRTFRKLSGIRGRALDHFVLESGRVLTSGWLLDASYSFLLDVGADIDAFRMIQETPSEIRIEIVPGKEYSAEMNEAIRNRFQELVNERLKVRVELVREIQRSGSGKYHPIISKVSQAS